MKQYFIAFWHDNSNNHLTYQRIQRATIWKERRSYWFENSYKNAQHALKLVSRIRWSSLAKAPCILHCIRNSAIILAM